VDIIVRMDVSDTCGV